MAILVVFQNCRNRKLLVIDLYKQIWCLDIHLEGPAIFTFASSRFDYFLKMAVNENA